MWWLCSWLAAKALVIESTKLPNADAIVVMSGSSAFVERTHAAAQLFKEGIAPVIILTNDGQQGGWDQKKQKNPYTYELATDELLRHGVPSSSIRVIGQVISGTFDEATAIHDLSSDAHFKSVIVVTSGYHSRRTRWTFQHVFDNQLTVGVFAVPPGQETPSPSTWWWYPKGWRSVGEEYVKLVYYKMRYSRLRRT
jgi:uncharacterized SAM-binding protein YcdF (DUF218 family)